MTSSRRRKNASRLESRIENVEFGMLIVLLLAVMSFDSSAAAQTPEPGRQVFVSRCAGCHGSDGNGGELGPAIASRVPSRTDDDLMSVVREGRPAAGMPAFPSVSGGDLAALIAYLRTLRPRSGSDPVRATIALASGGTIDGLVLNQIALDLQLLGDDRRIHLL